MDALSDDQLPSLIRSAIVGIVNGHPTITRLALQQRAKFEGWMKFELAGKLSELGVPKVRFESPLQGGHADLSFEYHGRAIFIELKMCPTNFGSQGKNITQNVEGICADCKRLRSAPGTGTMAFVMFPFPIGGPSAIRAELSESTYLERIRDAAGLSGAPEGTFVSITQDAGLKVYAFAVVPAAAPA
jgi:hypothetical protein